MSAQEPVEPAAVVTDIAARMVAIEERQATLEREKTGLEEKILLLEKSNQDLAASDKQLRQKLLVLNSAGKRFSRSLARRTFSNVSRHVAGMAGAAIPYVGADVLVGMTSLDVREGCESLEELNEMMRAMEQETVDTSRVCAMRVPTREEVLAQVIGNWRTAYAVVAARANQYEIRIPPEPLTVPYARASELWVAVFGVNPAAMPQTVPMGLISPTPPTPPTPPTIIRP